MYKKYGFLVCWVLLIPIGMMAQDSLAQDTLPDYLEEYYPAILAAEEASIFGSFAESQAQYASAFSRCTGFATDYFAAAEAAARNLSADTAFIWMRLAARNGMPLQTFKKSTAFRQYRNTEEWLKFQRDHAGLYRAWINTLNLSLRAEIVEMNRADKSMRTRKNMRSHYEQIALNDSINLSRVKRMIATKGFPGERVIGNFWVDRIPDAQIDPLIQHLALYDSAATLSILDRAVRRGEASPFLRAYTIDLLCAWKGQPQIYGTFIGAKNRVYPLADEENIDTIRAEAGLEPFDLYCIKNNLKYFFLHPPTASTNQP